VLSSRPEDLDAGLVVLDQPVDGDGFLGDGDQREATERGQRLGSAVG
jgi:hypothetical protein